MAFKRKNPAELQKQLADLKGGSSFSDSDKNEWRLKQDSAGNGAAVIRFLPAKSDDGLPFIKLVNHGFKLKTSWYIENCTSTHGDFDNCPVCKYISENDLYNTDKELYQKLKRKTSYWANILVIKDPAAPENEGKVMKFRFGQKIMDKINSMVEVDVDMGETPIDVTCPFEGANFSIKTKKVSGFSNYDESKFYPSSEIKGIEDEKYQNTLLEQMADLSELTAPSQFKTLEANTPKFEKALGRSTGSRAIEQQSKDLDEEINNFDSELDKKFDSDILDSKSSSSDDDEDLDGLLNSL